MAEGGRRRLWVDRPDFTDGKCLMREDQGRLFLTHAPEVTAAYSAELWRRRNNLLSQGDRYDTQVVVIPGRLDVTGPFYRYLLSHQLGRYPVLTTRDHTWPEGEITTEILGDVFPAKHFYVVASIYGGDDRAQLIRVAAALRRVYGAQFVTAVFPFLGGTREDKNVGRDGAFSRNTINVDADLGAMSPFFDGALVVEPHSSATTAFAALHQIPFAPLSLWKFMVDHLLQQGVILPGNESKRKGELTRENMIVVRPDVGRNIAASRLEAYLGVPGVSFSKHRESGTDVSIYELTPKEQALVRGKVAVLYDDEASTSATLRRLVDKLEQYGVTAVAALLAHLKLTEQWLDQMDHPRLTTVIGTDSRVSVGNPFLAPKLHVVSLIDWLYQIIGADIAGVDFWDSDYRDLILQPTLAEMAE